MGQIRITWQRIWIQNFHWNHKLQKICLKSTGSTGWWNKNKHFPWDLNKTQNLITEYPKWPGYNPNLFGRWRTKKTSTHVGKENQQMPSVRWQRCCKCPTDCNTAIIKNILQNKGKTLKMDGNIESLSKEIKCINKNQMEIWKLKTIVKIFKALDGFNSRMMINRGKSPWTWWQENRIYPMWKT